MFNNFLTTVQQLLSFNEKSKSLKNTIQTYVKQAFLTLKNGLKNSSFEASKTVLFETFDSALSDFDFVASLTSS